MLQKIVVGSDTSASADLAVKEAAELAKSSNAELVVLYVKPAAPAKDVFDPKKAPDPAGYLRQIGQRFPGIRIRTREEPGEPAAAICRVAEAEDADLIVVGNRGIHGRRRSFLGSVPGGVMRKAPTSVYVVDTRVAH